MAAPPNPALIFDLLQAHQKTAALRAAIELDLFRAVGEGPGDAASLAKQCGASERGIRILCDFLTINDVLVKEDGRYRHSAMSGVFLDPRSPASLASIAKFLGNPAMRDPYDRLSEVIRQGHTTLPGDGSVEPENPIWVEFAETMAPMMRPMAGSLAAAAFEGITGPVRVLDIAAGHGLFGIEVAKMNPAAKVTGLDWASVLEVALRNAREAGIAERYEILPGSAFEVEFGGPYDAVLLTNFLHHFDRATCVGLLKKVHAALAPGGRAATLEFVPNEDRISPPIPAAFAMTMLASTMAGDAYTLTDLTTMYHEAGFRDVTARPVQNGPHTIVLGVV
jgi:2-polyprenyl-3-methyl-5-hydroxy-6-metoxy-1,4-benzoquinol methylase